MLENMFPQIGNAKNVPENQPLPKAVAPTHLGHESQNAYDGVKLSAKAGDIKLGKPYYDRVPAVLLVPGICEKGGDSMHDISDYLTRTGVNEDGGVIDARLHMKELPLERIREMSNDELCQALKLNPDGNVFRMNYSTTGNTIEQNAKELKWATEIASRLTGQQQVDLVAHSKGGLDARKLLEDPEEKIGKLINIGTPNKGSLLEVPNVLSGGLIGTCILGLEENGGSEQLLPEWINPTLQALNKNRQKQERAAQIFSIATEHDGVVALDSALLPGSESYVLDGDINHCQQASSVEVQELVGELLAGRHPNHHH